jgi:hypothetical protein
VVQGSVADGGAGDDDFDAGGGDFFDYLQMSVLHVNFLFFSGEDKKRSEKEKTAPSPYAPPPRSWN